MGYRLRFRVNLRITLLTDSIEVALQYKRLWMVEAWFRSCKSLLQTRPIFHRCDETIRGHVFCSFLALVLRQELEARLAADSHEFEWADVIQDLDRLQVVEVEQDGKRFLLRSEVQGTCGAVFRGRGGRAPDRAAGPTGPCGHGAGSWCHAAFVDLQIATLQWVTTVYCQKPVLLVLDSLNTARRRKSFFWWPTD